MLKPYSYSTSISGSRWPTGLISANKQGNVSTPVVVHANGLLPNLQPDNSSERMAYVGGQLLRSAFDRVTTLPGSLRSHFSTKSQSQCKARVSSQHKPTKKAHQFPLSPQSHVPLSTKQLSKPTLVKITSLTQKQPIKKSDDGIASSLFKAGKNALERVSSWFPSFPSFPPGANAQPVNSATLPAQPPLQMRVNGNVIETFGYPFTQELPEAFKQRIFDLLKQYPIIYFSEDHERKVARGSSTVFREFISSLSQSNKCIYLSEKELHVPESKTMDSICLNLIYSKGMQANPNFMDNFRDFDISFINLLNTDQSALNKFYELRESPMYSNFQSFHQQLLAAQIKSFQGDHSPSEMISVYQNTQRIQERVAMLKEFFNLYRKIDFFNKKNSDNSKIQILFDKINQESEKKIMSKDSFVKLVQDYQKTYSHEYCNKIFAKTIVKKLSEHPNPKITLVANAGFNHYSKAPNENLPSVVESILDQQNLQQQQKHQKNEL